VGELLPSAWDASRLIPVDLLGTIWVLLAAFMVFIMVPAIGMLEAGLTRQKNVINALMKSMTAVGVMSVAFVTIGFSLAFSPQSLLGLVGNPITYAMGNGALSLWPTTFGLNGAATSGIPLLAFLIFQLMFAAVTLALVGAGVPERMRFSAWLLFSLLFSFIVWPVVAHWVWSPSGILANLGTITGLAPGLGVRDFAGGIVVHVTAGFSGLAVTMALGASIKRRAEVSDRSNRKKAVAQTAEVKVQPGWKWTGWRPSSDFSPPPLPEKAVEREREERYGYSIPFAMIGTALLWFGWFGFNPGSSLGINHQTIAAVISTNLAAALGGLVTLMLGRAFTGKYDPLMTISGILAGLVIITPSAGYVDAYGAAALGLIGGVVVYFAMKFVDRYLYHADDPIGSFPCHGITGAVGTILVPVFANPTLASQSGIKTAGLLYGGGGEALGWLAVQTGGVVIAIIFVFGLCFGVVKVVSLALVTRAKPQEEIVGLDLVDHGVAVEQASHRTHETVSLWEPEW
jgi:Amt family ammonium transporter